MPKTPRKTKWSVTQTIVVAVVASPFLFLIWSAWQSSVYDAEMAQKVRQSFQTVPCDIKSVSYSELRSRVTEPTGSNRPPQTAVSGYDVHAEYTYTVGGQTYTSRRITPRYKTSTEAQAKAFVDRYQGRTGHTCYYDPSNPSVAFLEK